MSSAALSSSSPDLMYSINSSLSIFRSFPLSASVVHTVILKHSFQYINHQPIQNRGCFFYGRIS